MYGGSGWRVRGLRLVCTGAQAGCVRGLRLGVYGSSGWVCTGAQAGCVREHRLGVYGSSGWVCTGVYACIGATASEV